LRKIRGDGNRLRDAAGWSKAGLLEENRQFGIGMSTPREMVRLLELLEQGKIVDAAAPPAAKVYPNGCATSIM